MEMLRSRSSVGAGKGQPLRLHIPGLYLLLRSYSLVRGYYLFKNVCGTNTQQKIRTLGHTFLCIPFQLCVTKIFASTLLLLEILVLRMIDGEKYYESCYYSHSPVIFNTRRYLKLIWFSYFLLMILFFEDKYYASIKRLTIRNNQTANLLLTTHISTCFTKDIAIM